MNSFRTLSEDIVADNPLDQFEIWYKEHQDIQNASPDAVTLGTASSRGQVSLRTVLLKGYGPDGFSFFTNSNSRKAMHLSANPKAALLFYWPGEGRQIRIEGSVVMLSDEESSAYFATRPRESQIGAWASEQSFIIPDRKHLESRYDLYKQLFDGKTVEKPPYWGGYRLVPAWYEFWQEREYRLHDRITYSKRKGLWEIDRLAP